VETLALKAAHGFDQIEEEIPDEEIVPVVNPTPKPTSPKTGDGIALWLALAGVSSAGVLVPVAIKGKKFGKKQ
jgi:hypothetical protein